MCAYFDNKLNGIEGPALFYSTEQVPRSGEAAITLQVFNVKKSIAEALLIQTVRSFLNELGYTNHAVRVNSLGDSDSVTRYVRELTNYLRKRIDVMPAPARELMKDHALVALMHLIEREHELAKKSPSPLEYLTDTSRKHFREIVEFLDISGIPYEVDTKLIGHHECYSEALFAFDLIGEDNLPMQHEPLYVRGGRYSTFISRMSKSKTAAAGAVIVLRDKKVTTTQGRPRQKNNPSVFLIQLGFGPKVRSLLLLDELRSAGITAHQNVMSDSLSEQLHEAERRKSRFAIIVGQKEYVEKTVILRDLVAQSQEYVPMHALTSKLRQSIGA
jgi:histidyl-tRNA synthetase